MTTLRTVLLSGLVLGSLLPVQLCAAHLQPPPAAAPAEVKLPDTRAGKAAALYLEAHNSGDPRKMDDFLAKHLPRGLSNPQFTDIQQSSGGFEVIRLRESRDLALHLEVKSKRSGRDLVLVVALEEAPPHAIRVIGLTTP